MKTSPNLAVPSGGTQKYRWWHGALFLAGITALSSLPILNRKQREQRRFYRQRKLPVWAPPGAAFPVLWPLNNLALAWGGLRLLNAPRAMPHRRTLLALQGVLWLDFITYGAVYFGLRSPVLSAVWTVGDAVVSATSLKLARATADPKLPLTYLPITAWTSFASTVAVYDALRNRDEFFGTDAPLNKPPVPALEKAGE